MVGLFAFLGAVSTVIEIGTYLFPDTGEQRIIDVAADRALTYAPAPSPWA